MNENYANSTVMKLTAQIVTAHVGHNTVPGDTLPALIQSVFVTLAQAGQAVIDPPKPQPAVPVKKSVFPQYLVCLEDGKRMTMLKRHLATAFNLTPVQYRQRWSLPSNYPMVAPDYAARRSSIAKAMGFGQKPKPETRIRPMKRRHKAA